MLSRHFVLQGSWPPPLYSLSWPYGMVASPTLLAGLAAASPPPRGGGNAQPPGISSNGASWLGWGGAETQNQVSRDDPAAHRKWSEKGAFKLTKGGFQAGLWEPSDTVSFEVTGRRMGNNMRFDK